MQPEYELVAKQWSKQKHSNDDEHFFAVLDFQDGQQIYQRVSRAVPASAARSADDFSSL